MAALDTNVVVRLLMGDDLSQARAAEALVASESCTVSLAVLMECEWVLRAAYGLDAATIADLLAGLLALQNLDADDPLLASEVLLTYAAGLDFADALHALQARAHRSFATFDKTLVRRAGKLGLDHVQLARKP
jgi:predicted nucleic-acid-binding protein